jgi:hypothetical protein
MAGRGKIEEGRAVEGRMGRKFRIALETVLFLTLITVVTGIWAYLWLPPF